jgi:hypothetical protein
MSRYHALALGYGTALAAWSVLQRIVPLWPATEPPHFEQPWREVGKALLATVAILVLGQLYFHGIKLPRAFDPLNHVLIFSPLLLVRRGAWLPADRVWARLAIGFGLALLGVTAYTALQPGSILAVYQRRNLTHLVQVFLEDLGISILFVRFRAAIGLRATIALVAALFAAGHLPTLTADPLSLVLDTVLAAVGIAVLQRSADVWWFWQVHFAMDMMQFQARADPLL